MFFSVCFTVLVGFTEGFGAGSAFLWGLVLPATLGTVVVARALGPRMARDAVKAKSAWEGGCAGLAVTFLSYLVGAALLGLGLAVNEGIDRLKGPETASMEDLSSVLRGAVQVFAFALMYSPLFIIGLPFGMTAGWLFYRTIRRGET
ncbi:MAG: hypothetical protein AAGF99_08645 [Bacteroidota bacterium]